MTPLYLLAFGIAGVACHAYLKMMPWGWPSVTWLGTLAIALEYGLGIRAMFIGPWWHPVAAWFVFTTVAIFVWPWLATHWWPRVLFYGTAAATIITPFVVF